ncbi:MAG: AIR synthase-related protein, partial [Streptosporangiaceae bacterium]
PPGCGVRVEIPAFPEEIWLELFAETASRVVVSCLPERAEEVAALAHAAGIAAVPLGRTQPADRGFTLVVAGQPAIELELASLQGAWGSGLERWLRPEVLTA